MAKFLYNFIGTYEIREHFTARKYIPRPHLGIAVCDYEIKL